ncbi:ribosome assembly factor SBDS [Caldiplasma sukawensis]
MVKLDDAIIARYEHAGHKFEILVDPDAIEKIREGKLDLEKDIASETVFKDAKKGERAGEDSIKEVFKTDKLEEIVFEIVKKGQIQLTTEQRHRMQESKRKAIINIIAKEGFNPQTNAPNPPSRIEAAMEEAKVHIDPFKPINEQLNYVLKEIKPLIPIRMEKTKIAIRIEGELYGKLYGEINRLGNILKEEWSNDGKWICVLEIPSGMYGEILSEISRRAKDGIEIKKI